MIKNASSHDLGEIQRSKSDESLFGKKVSEIQVNNQFPKKLKKNIPRICKNWSCGVGTRMKILFSST